MDLATWDDVFGSLDARTLDHDQRLDFINERIERALRGKTWAAMSGGDEGRLSWDAAIQAFLDGNWVAVVHCCHAVCERELAGVISASTARMNDEVDAKWEAFGMGKLLDEVAEHDLLPPELIDELRDLASRRKPYGH